MSIDRAVSLDGNSLVLTILILIWTGMAVAMRARAFSPSIQRKAFTLTTATSAALLAWSFWSQPRPQPSDLAPVWAGARALLHQENPYTAVGPGRDFEWPFPLLYPMTAVVTLIPLAPMPLHWVDPLFVGLGFGLFVWAITWPRLWTPTLIAIVSLPALMALQTSQWSLLLTGAAIVPGFGFLLIAKPTIGLALFAAFPRRTTAIGCAMLAIFSILIRPGWVADWQATFASAPHVVAPITRVGGPLVLLALLKWKRSDARLLLALACVPHTTALYETIPLFLIPQTWLQAWCLWTLALLAYLGQWMTGPYLSQSAYWASGAQWIVMLLYLPCLGMVLCRANAWSGPGDQPTPNAGISAGFSYWRSRIDGATRHSVYVTPAMAGPGPRIFAMCLRNCDRVTNLERSAEARRN